jgi:hypothetical protein
MSCPGKITAKTYLTHKEYSIVQERAQEAGLSVSSFIKAMSLEGTVKSKLDKHLILELAKISADLGRLGGLLKLARVYKLFKHNPNSPLNSRGYGCIL